MTVIVRDFRPGDDGDAEAVTRVRRAALPHLVTTPEALVFGVEHANPAAKYRLLVAEKDGEIIGTAPSGIVYDSDEPGQSFVNLTVHPDHRGQGAGGLLLRTAEEHLAAVGATAVYAWVLDDPESMVFAQNRGFSPSRSALFLRLRLADATLPEPPALPAGAELRTAADFADNPRPLFEADAAVTADEPGDIPVTLDYEDWLNRVWNDPLLDRELTTVAVADGKVVAFSAAMTDGRTRYMSGMTGTLAAYRGQGLAKIAKADSLRRARAAGYTEAFTGNDAANRPMLSVNQWFGYELCTMEVRHVRTIG